MFPRPRFRNYEPLVTTQVRLRNLIKLSGINLICSEDEDDKTSKIYFTLHLSAFSKPIYTSEKIQLKKNVDWAEINCPQVFKSSQKFAVIRVWKHKEILNSNDSSKTDQLMFFWGVYFTGLIAISKHELSFKDNTLLFHIFDEVFSSPDQVIIPQSINCDQQLEIYSSSPANNSLTKSNSNGNSSNDTTETISVNNEIIKELKIKLNSSEFPKFEISSSYNVNKLMRLQELQRIIKQKSEASKLLADRICMKSAACLNIEMLMNKPVIYETRSQPGMGKQLSRLLMQQSAPPKPETILKIHELKKDIECAKFRIKLLTLERDRYRLHNKAQEIKREKLKDDNTETETLIWNSMRTLGRDNLKTHQEKLILQNDVLKNVKLALGETKKCLLRELNEIYRIEKNSDGKFCINNIHLPDAESYHETTSTATQISIALGYVAHAVLIIAKILNIPLRNTIIHEGSRSKIVDNIKILPPSDRV